MSVVAVSGMYSSIPAINAPCFSGQVICAEVVLTLMRARCFIDSADDAPVARFLEVPSVSWRARSGRRSNDGFQVVIGDWVMDTMQFPDGIHFLHKAWGTSSEHWGPRGGLNMRDVKRQFCGIPVKCC